MAESGGAASVEMPPVPALASADGSTKEQLDEQPPRVISLPGSTEGDAASLTAAVPPSTPLHEPSVPSCAPSAVSPTGAGVPAEDVDSGSVDAAAVVTDDTDLVQALSQMASSGQELRADMTPSQDLTHTDMNGVVVGNPGDGPAGASGAAAAAATAAGIAYEQQAESKEATDTVGQLRKIKTVPILISPDKPRPSVRKTLSWRDQHGSHLTHVCYADDLEQYGDAVYESPRDEPGCCIIL